MRSLLRSWPIGGLCLLLAASGVLASGPAPAPSAPKKILLVAKDRDHPPRTHEYMAESELLAKCLRQTPGVEATVVDGWPKDAKALEGVDAIVLYTAVGGDVLFQDESRRAQVEALIQKGVGLVLIHWGTDASPGIAGDKTLEHFGGWFHRPPSEIPVAESVIRNVAGTHPIGRGWTDFPMKDEYYIKLKFGETYTPIMKANVNGDDYVVGWAYDRPAGGRSFATGCGHFHECFAIEPFRKVLVNGILWAAGAEVPEAGAPVAVTDADLVLPPDPRETAR
jgi:type 1 glutamine amidotransferase